MNVIIYNLARRIFSQQTRNNIKEILFKINFKIKKILRYFLGELKNDELLKDLITRLGSDYDILMIHSSVNNMYPIYSDNLKLLLNSLVEYCQSNNITLAMPAFVFGDDKFFDAAKYYRTNIFDVNKSKSQMGLLTELFRRYPGVKRSIHPTFSVCALGPLAEKITKEHHLQTTKCGIGTPFGFMAEYNTKILGLGAKYFQVLTQANAPRDILKEDFPFKFNTLEVVPVKCINHSGDEFVYPLPNIKQDFLRDAVVMKSLLNDVVMNEWKLKSIPMFITNAKAVTETLIAAAKNGKTIYRRTKS